MIESENKTIVRRFIELGWGRLDESVFDDCMDANCIRHLDGAVSSGKSDARDALRRVARGMPDLSVTIELLIADGDLVAVRSRTRATHLGPYLGLEATGRKVEFTAVDFYRLLDGRIVESWHNVDEAGLRRQLGNGPTASEPES